MARLSVTFLRVSSLGLLALVLFLIGGRPAPVHAAPFTVTRFDDPLPDGCVAGDCSLREAITAANGVGGPMITLPAGTYALTIATPIPEYPEDANASGDLDITDEVSITGAGAATTIIDGSGFTVADRVLHVVSGAATISGVTVQGGLIDFGAGIRNDASLTLTDSIVDSNYASVGGGIWNDDDATVILTDSVLSGNTGAGRSGGIENEGTAILTDVTVTGNTGGPGSMGVDDAGGIMNVGPVAQLVMTGGSITGNTAFGDGGGIFNFGGTVELTGTTVSGNDALFGGGISNSGGSVTLTDSTVSANTGGAGGGIYSDDTLTLTNTTVSGNSATGGFGGGIRNEGGTATLTDSTINGNTATIGGGIYNTATLAATNSTIADNTASERGGGIHIDTSGAVEVTGSTFSGNTALTAGGAISNGITASPGTLTLENVTISGNQASSGAGINNFSGSSATLTNVTISNNEADVGGGIANGGTVALKNTIVANSVSGGDCNGVVTSNGHNLDSDGTCGLAGPGDLPLTDPNLGPLADNGGPTETHALLSGSPAIDAGDSASCPVADQRGFPRPRGAACDIGAFEYLSDSAVASGDFDGDGRDDLAVGAPGEDVGAIADAGAVNVLYGSGSGLTASGDQLWHQGLPGVLGQAEAGDLFGDTLATGDFDGDGFDDLAIGAPGENIGAIADAGAVNVLYGSPSGLTDVGDQLWHQGLTGVLGQAEGGDRFGDSLASGDYGNDGKDDLAVGAPGEDLGATGDAGAVNVLYGSGSGLKVISSLWHQGLPEILGQAEAGDRFGQSLASGDFDADGDDDLAVGAPGEDVGTVADAGTVNVLYGESHLRLSVRGNQLWHQGLPGVLGQAEAGDRFGQSLATGDFDGDGKDDLVVGAPGEDVGAIGDAGAVNVLYGSPSGLTDVGDQLWHQSSPGILGTAEAGDRFGAALATGDFDGDGKDDLAVGAPGEDVGAIADAGAVNVLYGSPSGLTDVGDQLWHQALTGVIGQAEAGDLFGDTLVSGDFDADGKDDLTVGAPGENIGAIEDAGAANVLYGSGSGLSASGDQLWHQALPGVLGTAEAGDRFAFSLGSGHQTGPGTQASLTAPV